MASLLCAGRSSTFSTCSCNRERSHGSCTPCFVDACATLLGVIESLSGLLRWHVAVAARKKASKQASKQALRGSPQQLPPASDDNPHKLPLPAGTKGIRLVTDAAAVRRPTACSRCQWLSVIMQQWLPWWPGWLNCVQYQLLVWSLSIHEPAPTRHDQGLPKRLCSRRAGCPPYSVARNTVQKYTTEQYSTA